jgi:hypothetical protein
MANSMGVHMASFCLLSEKVREKNGEGNFEKPLGDAGP